MNSLPQIIHRRKMFFPKAIQDIEHDAFLKHPELRSYQCFLLDVFRTDLTNDSLSQSILKKRRIFIQPVLNRQLHVKLGVAGRLQARHVPLLLQALRRNVPINDFINDIIPESIDNMRDFF